MERKLVVITGIWQIIHGLISVIYFGVIKRADILAEVYAKYGEQISLGNVTSMIYLFGLIMVILGIINLVVSNNYMGDNTINKAGYWLIFVAIVSLFSSDFISLILSVSATVLYFAKNKAIKTLEKQ